MAYFNTFQGRECKNRPFRGKVSIFFLGGGGVNYFPRLRIAFFVIIVELWDPKARQRYISLPV